MQIEISSDLLESSESRLSLLGLLAHGLSGRHVVLVDPAEEGAADAYNDWVSALADRKLQEEIKQALDEGDRRASLGVRRRLKVSVTGSSPSVSLDRALMLCGYPYRVLLENGRTDRDFLLAAAGAHRNALADASKKGWLLFETAGGKEEVKKRLEELQTQTCARERFFCLVDSDAKDPEHTSDTSARVQEDINAIGTTIRVAPNKVGKILTRRASENYLDIHAFQSWLKTELASGVVNDILTVWRTANDEKWESLNDNVRGTHSSRRRALIAALALGQLSENVWKYFDFSLGRSKADGSPRTADSVWFELSPLQQSALEHGIAKKFIREFYSSDSAKTDPSTNTELKQIIRSILERT